jgi:hypothetical protein
LTAVWTLGAVKTVFRFQGNAAKVAGDIINALDSSRCRAPCSGNGDGISAISDGSTVNDGSATSGCNVGASKIINKEQQEKSTKRKKK